MANIRTRTDKEGKTYHTVQIRLKGYPPQTASFDRITDAKKWAATTESSIREGRHFKTAEAKKHNVEEMIDRYLAEFDGYFKPNELRIRRPILKWWKSQIGYRLLSDLSSQDFVTCRNRLQNEGGTRGQGLAAATVKRYFVTISHVLQLCQTEWKWLQVNPLEESKIKLPAPPNGIDRFLDADELARLTAACQSSTNPLLYPAFILSVSTGMRQAETMNLYWREPSNPPEHTAWGVVNLADNCIILRQTKNGKPRRVPLAGEALAELQKLSKVQRLDTQLVFPSPTHPHKPIELKKAWMTALNKAEVANFRWHDLRHTAASYLAMNGAPLLDIAAILGHRTLDMVQRYSHLSDSHVSGVVAAMNKKMFGGV